MELVERYIYAVTKILPYKIREEIGKEIRVLIEDMISAKCGDKSPEESDIKQILTELGEPSKLAAKYSDERNYLIGPELFDIYLLVVKIVMIVVVFGVLVGKCVELFVNPPSSVAIAISGVISAIVEGAFQGFTWVTIVFAINERFNTKLKEKRAGDSWNLSNLPSLPDKKGIIKKADPIVGIVFGVIFIILFNLSNNIFGVYHFEGNKFASVVTFFSTEGIRPFMPYLTMLFCLSIFKECIKLISGRWTLTLGIVCAVISLITMIGMITIFSNPVIWNQEFVSFVTGHNFIRGSVGFPTAFMYIIVIALSIEIIVSVAKGIRYSNLISR